MANSVKQIIALFTLFIVINKTNAQVGIGTTNPDPSAALHVYDTARGMLIPRLTSLQRNAIQNPAEGLLIYQIDDNARGFWYFTVGQWKSIASSIGKTVLVLADTITNAQAQLKIATEVGPNTQEIRIIRCSNLTSVDLSMISTLIEIYISDNPVLQSVDLSNLSSVDGGMYVNNCPALTNLPIGAITRVGRTYNGSTGLSIINTRIPNINMPLLKIIGGTLRVRNDSTITAVNLPILADVLGGDVEITGNPVLSTISLHALRKTTSYLTIEKNPVLTSLNLTSLASTASIVDINCGTVTNLSFPALTTTRMFHLSGSSLISLSFPVLSTSTDDFTLGAYSTGDTAMSSLTSLSLPVLTSTNKFVLYSAPVLTTLSLPMLQSTLQSWSTIGGFNIDSVGITTLSVPLLQNGDQFWIRKCNSLTSVSLPALQIFSGFSISNNASLTSVSLPSFTNVNGFTISQNPNLTSLSINNITSAPTINLSGNKLSSSDVNTWLHRYATHIPLPTNKTLDFRQSIPAPPTGQGITDKAILVGAPNTVSTD